MPPDPCMLFDAEFGRIGVAADENGITRVYLPGELPDEASQRKNARAFENRAAGGSVRDLLLDAGRQIGEYLAGRRREFDLPLSPGGSAFMRLVWVLLRAIPYGETASYAQIAARADRPKAYRAVGLACNRNPIPLIIPCHRVVGSSGELTGYRGGLIMKKRLLEMERLSR